MLVKQTNKTDQLKTPAFNKANPKQPFVLTELTLGILAGLWMVMAMAIYFLLQSTLISLLDASRWYFLFGLIGFGAAFYFRKQFGFSLIDGLYGNVFITGPICLLLLLGLNQITFESYIEQYKVVDYDSGNGHYIIKLEDNAYESFWRIRNVESSTNPSRFNYVEFTFCDGLFGYKVLKKSRLY